MSDERRYKSFEVVIKSSVTIYVYADNEADARQRWRECMEDNPGYIEELYDHAEVESISEETWCDHCGGNISHKTACFVTSLPVSIESANAGESATLCEVCYHYVVNKKGDTV